MSEYTKPEKSIWKLADGKIWEGPQSELPKSNASLIAKAGYEYPTAWLKEQGWGKKAPAKKAPVEKAPVEKAAAKKPAETKAVKKAEDK